MRYSNPLRVLVMTNHATIATAMAMNNPQSSRSKNSGILAFSMMGGFWGPELKHAGYDKLVFRGKSTEPVYLWIQDDKVELRDAKHLMGLGTLESAEIIRMLIDEVPEGRIVARGPGDAPEVDGLVIIDGAWEDVAAGDFIAVQVNGYDQHDLFAEPV